MKKFYMFLLCTLMSFPALFAGDIYFYFQDGEEDDFELMNPASLVSIYNGTLDEYVAVPEGANFVAYSIDRNTHFTIKPVDFDYSLVIEVEGEGFVEDSDGNGYYLVVSEFATDIEVTIKVYLSDYINGGGGGGSGIESVGMSFNVNSSDSAITNPGSLIGIEYFDRTSYTNEKVEIEDNYGYASVVPGTSFTISPAEGYEISNIMTYIDDVATISEPGQDSYEWYIAVDESPAADFCSFFITVEKASTEGPGPGPDPGEEPGEENLNAVITQIADLQWTVTWEDFDFVNAQDSEFGQNYAYLTDDKGNKTILHANLHDTPDPTVIFPTYGNYFTVNLEGLGIANGSYILTIPAGYVTLSNFGSNAILNIEQQLGLTVGGTPDVSYTPQISAIEGNYFDISWENVTSLTEGNTNGAYLQNVSSGARYDMLYLEDYMYSKANLRIDNNKLRVNVTNNYPDLPSGTYKFYLPANYVKFNGTSTGNDAIDGYEFQYTQPWSEGNVEFNGPSSDDKITLTWVDASEIEYDTAYAGDGNTIKGVTIFHGDGFQINVSYPGSISISKNVMTIDLDGLGLADGECRVLVPEDCLLVTVNGVTDYTYGVSFDFVYGDGNSGGSETPLYSGSATWNVQSGGSVAQGSLVEVGWDNAELSLVADAEDPSIHNFETGIIYLYYGSEVYLSEDKTKLLLDMRNMPSGIFRINVPEACVEFDIDGVTYRNQATSMDNVNINSNSGVGIVAGDNGRYVVVDINGVRVLDSEDAEALGSLAKGLYIVNGKKVFKQ